MSYLLVFMVTILSLAENVKIPINIGKLGRKFQPVYTWLAKQADDFAIIELPLPAQTNIAKNLGYMYSSTSHWKKLVNGCSGYHPKSYNKLQWALRSFPQPGSIRYLKEHYPVKYIILHSEKYPKNKRKQIIEDILKVPDELKSVTNFGNKYVIELKNKGAGERIVREFPDYWLRGKNLQLKAKMRVKLPDAKNYLQIYLNNDLVKSFTIDEQWKQFRFPIPNSKIKYGINTFEFKHAGQQETQIIIENLELVR